MCIRLRLSLQQTHSQLTFIFILVWIQLIQSETQNKMCMTNNKCWTWVATEADDMSVGHIRRMVFGSVICAGRLTKVPAQVERKWSRKNCLLLRCLVLELQGFREQRDLWFAPPPRCHAPCWPSNQVTPPPHAPTPPLMRQPTPRAWRWWQRSTLAFGPTLVFETVGVGPKSC